MTVRNCKNCKRLFNYIAGVPLCPACKEELEKTFTNVKEYVRANKNATISDLVKEFDLPESQIREWIREERLIFTSGVDCGLYCENCGAIITTGRFCDKCKAETINGFNSLVKKPETPVTKRKPIVSAKMRFFDNM